MLVGMWSGATTASMCGSPTTPVAIDIEVTEQIRAVILNGDWYCHCGKKG
jgi:hypothetical protein